jgi:hypothetical protein
MAVAGLGLLLWARLILVSDMPRMALAEPEVEPEVEVASVPVAESSGNPDAEAARSVDAPVDGGAAPR